MPGRIVSLTPNLTEILFALGAGTRVVGVTQNDHFPAEVESLPKLGGLEIDWESLIRLKPDITVLDADLNKQHLSRLNQLGLNVLSFHSQSLAGMRQAVTGLAEKFGLGTQGQALLGQLDQALQAAKRRSQKWPRRPTVLVEIWGQPLMTAGGDTYVDEVLQAAGGDNVGRAWNKQYPSVSTEKLLELDPEIIILVTLDVNKAKSLPGWSHLRAVREDHIYSLPGDLLVRPTLRLPEGVKQLQDKFEMVVSPQSPH